MALKKISFYLKHYVFKSYFFKKLRKILAAVVYFMSEFEAEIQIPGNATPLRYIYLRLIKVKFGIKSYFGRGIIIYQGNQLHIGKHASIGEKAMFHAHGKILIGDDFLAAPGLTINSGGHRISDLKPFDHDVTIGNRVWCGVNVTILAGVTIGDDVIIGACAVVNKDIPSNSVAIGAPAKVTKNINRENLTVWKWHQNAN